jgi:hypothetical protein
MGVVLVDESGAPVGGDDFRVYPENTTAARLFYACGTQWQRNPMTGDLWGLNYAGVESAARLAGIDATPELFGDLQLIEQGALGAKPDYPDLDALNIITVSFDDGEGL